MTGKETVDKDNDVSTTVVPWQNVIGSCIECRSRTRATEFKWLEHTGVQFLKLNCDSTDNQSHERAMQTISS